MVIYSTTRDKPVLGEMRERDFVKCRQKGILWITAKPEKLLQLRVSGILVSSHQHKPPFFRFPPPSPLISRAPSYFIYYLCYCITLAGTELLFDFHYVITKRPAENHAVEIVENITGGVRAAARPTPKKRKNAVLLFNFSTRHQAHHSWKCE